MRTLLLVSTMLLLAACSDNQQATAPRSVGSATSGAGDRIPATASQTNSKPIDQVGFTKITRAWLFPHVAVSANSTGTGTATCPAGTTVINGGYRILGVPNGGAFPIVIWSEDDGANGWTVILNNTQPGSVLLTLEVFAYCAS